MVRDEPAREGAVAVAELEDLAALLMAASILSRLRMMPASASSRCAGGRRNGPPLGVEAVVRGWNASRFLRMVSHDSPAWLISSTSRSNSSASSRSGKPYSRSW